MGKEKILVLRAKNMDKFEKYGTGQNPSYFWGGQRVGGAKNMDKYGQFN